MFYYICIYGLMHLAFSLVAYRYTRAQIKQDGKYTAFDRKLNLIFSTFFSWIWLIIFAAMLKVPVDEKEREVRW